MGLADIAPENLLPILVAAAIVGGLTVSRPSEIPYTHMMKAVDHPCSLSGGQPRPHGMHVMRHLCVEIMAHGFSNRPDTRPSPN